MNLLVPPAPTPQDFAPLLSLLALVVDPAATKTRIEQLMDAAAKVRDAITEFKKQEAALADQRREHDAARKLLADERAKQADKLADVQRAHDAAHQDKVDRLKEREAGLVNRERRLAADREAVDTLRADLERRLAAIKAATA